MISFCFPISLQCLLVIVLHGTCLICGVGCIHCVFFLYQLGYTKKQEERHFRGVITLEVCIAFAFYILCFLLCGSEMVYDYIIFAYSVQQFFFPLVERYTDLAKHGLYVTTKVVRCIAIATYAAKLYSFVGV